MKDHSYARTLFLVVIVVAGAFTGGAVAASDGSVEAEPSTPGETAQHVVSVTVGDDSAGSLTGLEVDYSGSGIDLNNVSQSDIVKIGIDRDDDADGRETDENANDDLDSVSASNDGETLTIDTGGSYSIESGDEIVVVIDGLTNPSAGEYDVTIDINPQSSGGETTATLTIGASDGDDDDGTATDSDDDSMDGDDSAGGDDENGDGETTTSTPGFGVTVALVALIGTALFVARRT
ncbi:PGF-CTERM sorting domain-containing protein [Salinirubrum litoreum]|uniref:PGF-CTERM sorting domain-containing protein n=1 Tax=Salinirubrum litoreum TaxID=1126234 RepID=A0ABD5R9F3_9EURY|nr:PGF-CTERM sorting domain-containing protein [Salinirubrum litoreum]